MDMCGWRLAGMPAESLPGGLAPAGGCSWVTGSARVCMDACGSANWGACVLGPSCAVMTAVHTGRCPSVALLPGQPKEVCFNSPRRSASTAQGGLLQQPAALLGSAWEA
eukprot:366437-Chlamydomonas_euryale.AAC.10